jgi:hypothetical protein
MASPGAAVRVAGEDVEAVPAVDVEVEASGEASDSGADAGEFAVDEPDAASESGPESVPADADGSDVDESESVGLAHATPWPVATAAATPRATANPPTRPT